MAKCLAKAQMEAELDNALKQLELETRKCINRRLKKSGIDKKTEIPKFPTHTQFSSGSTTFHTGVPSFDTVRNKFR